jgi:hypothetical protein
MFKVIGLFVTSSINIDFVIVLYGNLIPFGIGRARVVTFNTLNLVIPIPPVLSPHSSIPVRYFLTLTFMYVSQYSSNSIADSTSIILKG